MTNSEFKFKIDTQNRCIDRNSEEGKIMEEMQQLADSQSGTPMGDFMNQLIAYADVSAVVDQTMDRKQARQVVGKLRTRMNNEIEARS